MDALWSGLAGDLAFDLFGESVTYNDRSDQAGGSDSSSAITAVRQDSRDAAPLGPQFDQPTTWVVRAADVSAPNQGDQLTDSKSNVWTVRDVTEERGAVFFLICRFAHKGN